MSATLWLELLGFHRFLLGRTKARLGKYREAIKTCVGPGDIVLDLGSGSGALAFFACLAGARRVYAIESGPAIELAKVLARANGFDDRVVFLHGNSQELHLPERVDVLVTDTVGFWQPRGLAAMIDARDRLVKSGGVLIPRSVDFFIAAAELPQAYKSHIDFWSQDRQGIDLSAVRQIATHHCYPVRAVPGALLTKPALIASVICSTISATEFNVDTRLTVQRTGTLHGLCGWLETELAAGIGLTNCPGETGATTNYAQAFFPVSRPTRVGKGDHVNLRMQSHDSIHWRWQIELKRRTGTKATTFGEFDHATFRGIPLSAEDVRNLAPEHRPTLSARGEAEHFVLGLADGVTPIEELQRRVCERYPGVFKSREEANGFVAEVLNRCA